MIPDPALTRLAFTMHSTRGVYAVLLGAGASMGAQVPTAWQIVHDLIRKLAASHGEDAADPEAWYRDTFQQEPDYSALIAALAMTRDEQRALLEGYFTPSDDDRANGRRVPSAAHQALAALAKAGHVRVILTTNFDRLVEQALEHANVEYTVVSEANDLRTTPSLMHGLSLIHI